MQPDLAKLFNSEFDRNEQLNLIASTLEHLRAAFPEKWDMVGRGQHAPEFKKVIRTLVRTADESKDHHATVAYISKAALDALEGIAASRQHRRVFKKDLTNASRFSHEHATPVEVVLRTITLRQNQRAPILEILQALCCRVLITAAERKKVDSRHKWTVPATLSWDNGLHFGLRTLNPSLIPLIRYYKVDPELACSLIPLNPFHSKLLDQLHSLLAATPDELFERLRECQYPAGTSFVLSDDIYHDVANLKVRAD